MAEGWAKEVPSAAGFDGLLNLTLGPRPTGATLRVRGPAAATDFLLGGAGTAKVTALVMESSH